MLTTLEKFIFDYHEKVCSFISTKEFGLSMLSPDGRWFTETGRNSDGVKHAKVYQNLDDLDMSLLVLKT